MVVVLVVTSQKIEFDLRRFLPSSPPPLPSFIQILQDDGDHIKKALEDSKSGGPSLPWLTRQVAALVAGWVPTCLVRRAYFGGGRPPGAESRATLISLDSPSSTRSSDNLVSSTDTSWKGDRKLFKTILVC